MPRIRTLTGRTERHRNKMQARLKRNYEEKRRQKELKHKIGKITHSIEPVDDVTVLNEVKVEPIEPEDVIETEPAIIADNSNTE